VAEHAEDPAVEDADVAEVGKGQTVVGEHTDDEGYLVEGPIGAQRYTNWRHWADGREHTLRRGRHFFQEGRRTPDGKSWEITPAEQARGAFLSWASRRKFYTRATLLGPNSIKVVARPREDSGTGQGQKEQAS